MFHILYSEQRIGTSAFEFGDPPMGCVGGVFTPNENFASFLASDAPHSHDGSDVRRWNGLSFQTKTGVHVECVGVVLVEYDFGSEKEYEVCALGIAHPHYADLFPDHCAAYKAQFSNDK